jgi:DNA repair exonuclease SbcCD ATPase subunit
MKDHITAVTTGLFVEIGKVVQHMEAQAKRIAELEAQLEEAETLISQTSHGAAERISAMEAQLAAASPSDTDKLREAIEALEELADEAEENGNTSAWTNSMVEKVRSAMEAQASVREVPGYKLVPLEPTDEMYNAAGRAFHAWRHTTTTQPDFTHKDSYRAMLAAAPLPAAPVQQEAE